MTQIVAMIPELGELLLGVDYDVVMSEGTTHESEITNLPVDDPKKSFINDTNRDLPTVLDVQIAVGTINLAGAKVVETGRLGKLYGALLDLKRKQVEDPGEFLTVLTGTTEHRNMVITSITMSRALNQHQMAIFNITLQEFRFAKMPVKANQVEFTLPAGNGAVDTQNRTHAFEQDRPLVEGSQELPFRRSEFLSERDMEALAA